MCIRDSFETASEERLRADDGIYGEKTVEAYDIPDTATLTRKVLALQKSAYEADTRVSDGTESCVISRRRTVRLYNSLGLDLENSTGYSVAFIEAVSYTHLDVYKRQARIRPATARSGKGAFKA